MQFFKFFQDFFNEYVSFIILFFLIINFIAFIMFGIDKRKAKKNKWRIPEATLMAISLLGGSVGGLLGMKVFRHKTKHPKFYIGIPAILIIQIGLTIFIIIAK